MKFPRLQRFPLIRLPFVGKSINDFYNAPFIVIPVLLLFIFLLGFSLISVKINYSLNSNLSLLSWLIFFSIISLLAISFSFSGLIGISGNIVQKKKVNFYELFRYSKKFYLKNFVVMIVIVICYNIVAYVSNRGAFFIGKYFALPVASAKLIFFLIYFAGLAGGIIFLTFSSFFLIIRNKGIFKSFKESAHLVKKQYLTTFVILISFFVINGLLKFTGNSLFVEIINLFLIPYFSLILARIIGVDKNDI